MKSLFLGSHDFSCVQQLLYNSVCISMKSEEFQLLIVDCPRYTISHCEKSTMRVLPMDSTKQMVLENNVSW